MNKKFSLIYILTLIFFPTKAFAYLDPGTGSIILQAILGAIAAGATWCSIYWQKVKNFFSKKTKKKDEDIKG